MSTTLDTDQHTSEADLQAYQLVNQQYGVCTMKPGFFDDFYADFISQSPEIEALFSRVDMSDQKQALRSGLAYLIQFAAGKPTAAQKLEQLGKSHCRSGYNIRPDFYPVWIEALIRTVKKHSGKFDAKSEQAWRLVLQKGVDQIVSWY